MAGETVIGNYRIKEFIGRGGMGVVYRGQHLQLPRTVAIKSIDAREAHDLRRMRSRFEKEAYVQSQLDHPGIVKIYDYIVGPQTYYIVMEYVEGRSLAELCASEECPLPLERALDIFEQILTAIAYAQSLTYRDRDGSLHRGLVHRDLKPANILLTNDDQVKVTDFGIVKIGDKEITDTSGAGYGSPEYVSPEQAKGKDVDQRSDIYSLGIILYEMLTGDPPFGGRQDSLSRTEVLRAHVERAPRPPSEINKDVPPEIEALIMRALEKAPEERFRSALDTLRELRHARGRATDDLRQPEIVPPPIRENVGTAEIYDPATEHNLRESYNTQPIRSSPECDACGASVSPEMEHCPVCGHEVGASPATTRLARQGIRSRAPLIVAALILLALLGFGLLYMRRSGPSAAGPAPPAATPTPQPTAVPQSALVELRPAEVAVDSSYNGYSAEPLTDNEMDVQKIARMRYNRGNWSSAETPVEHWVEFRFEKPVRVAAVYVYWGFDRNRFMPSRRVELQVLVKGAVDDWSTIAMMEPGNDHDRMAFEFAPVTTQRLRVLQPAKEGPANRPFVMWVRELKVFGLDGP